VPLADWQYRAGVGREAVVLLPGWATDARIFSALATPGGVITPTGLLPQRSEGLADMIARHTGGPVHVLGWSLGAYLAVQFARAYPELVASLTLLGVRPCYPADELATLRLALLQDRAACLTAFYRRCWNRHTWWNWPLLRYYPGSTIWKP
jgi:pimeloyl-ACP methyl ester carboxylesterase